VTTREERLRHLNRRLMEAYESERARIARQLHDDIAQRMAVLTIELDSLNQALPLSLSELRRRIGALSDRTRALGKDVEAISHGLHSSKLDYLGVVSASADFCRELSERQHVEIAFTHDGIPEDVPKDAAICVFRVLQEAVTNAVQHAGVDRVAAVLRGSADEIQLEVVDGGRGFDPDEAMRVRGLGLFSMQERISRVKGDLSIESQSGAGTIVRARVPLHRAVA